jgi:hypothetical protein
MTIKGDYEAISTGYEQYVAKEVHNTQLINFLQVIGQFPEIKTYLKQEAFTRPLLRAFNMEPDKVVKTEEEVTKAMKAQSEATEKQLQKQKQEAEQAAQKQMQQQAQLQAQQIQGQARANIAVEENKALLDEKQSIGEDQRKMEMQERLELIKQGKVIHPANFLRDNSSVLMQEQMQQEQAAADEQRRVQEQQMMQQQAAEQQQQQQRMIQQQGPPQEAPPQPQGQMPEDPLQTEQARERMQGGPEAETIRRQEFAENAPQ